MKTAFKNKLFTSFIVAGIFIQGIAQAEKTSRLFVIERNTNANYVVYDAHLDDAGIFNPDHSVSAYWIMAAQDGHREELTSLERKRAYGFDLYTGEHANELVLSTKALPSQVITLFVKDGAAIATTEIQGRPAVLKKIFVQAKGGIIPKVKWVKLTGTFVDSGAAAEETITP